jgi:hypothetical protein
LLDDFFYITCTSSRNSYLALFFNISDKKRKMRRNLAPRGETKHEVYDGIK